MPTEATAEVRLGNHRLGTAVLVQGNVLLTARHILRDFGKESSTLQVVFPVSGDTFDVAADVDGALAADLSILTVVGGDPARLPGPIEVWPDDRLPELVSVFGLPHADRTSEGVWRDFAVSGPTSAGLRQLRWEEGAGTFKGQSGGPVVDSTTRQLVGILLAGSADGRFDRFLPIPRIAELWPALRRPWRYAGTGARSHFSRYSRGQRSVAQGGDLFRGRATALDAIADWLKASSAGRPLVVIGQPGSGKSAVLTRAALKAETRPGRGFAFHTRGAALDVFVDALAGFVGLAPGLGPDELVDGLKRQATGQLTIMVDALDEARTQTEAYMIAESLAELSRLPQVNVIVATRPMAAGDRLAPGSLLAKLLVQHAGPNLIDLDVEPYRDRAAIEAFAETMLSQDGVDHPSPPGLAWETYRSTPVLRSGLAKVIAERADPNFLVAAISSMALSMQQQVVNVRDPSFDPSSVASDLGEALTKYYSSIDTTSKQKVQSLLTSLACARGTGVSDRRWIEFATVLGYQVDRADIDTFRASPGADYLLQTKDGDGEPAVTLFHQALIDHFRAGRSLDDERRIYRALRDSVADDWSEADTYVRLHLADHASASRKLPELLQEDTDFVRVADVMSLVSAIDELDPIECPEVGHLILQEGPRLRELDGRERGWLLAMSAAHAGDLGLRDQFLGNSPPGLVPMWAQALGSSYQRISGHEGPIDALAVGRLGYHDVIVSGGADQSVRVWDRRGNAVLEPLTGHRAPVTAVAVGIVDDADVIVSGGSDGSVRLWNQSGEAIGSSFVGHTRAVSLVCIVSFEGDDAVLSIAPQGEIIVWNPEGRVLRRFPIDFPLAAVGAIRSEFRVVAVGYRNLSVFSPVDGHLWAAPVARTPKTAIAIGRLGSSDFVFCGLRNASVAVWRIDGTTARHPFTGSSASARSIAVGRFSGTDVIAAANQDNSLVIWDHRGSVLAEPWAGHGGRANAVAVGSLKGRDVIVCGGEDRMIRVWDSRALRSRGRTSRRGQIRALAAGTVANNTLIVTAPGRGVEFWNLDGRLVTAASNPRPVIVELVMTAGPADGMVIAVGQDRKVYLWDTLGAPLGEPIIKHTRKITAIASGIYDGGAVIASASRDLTTKIWRPDGFELASVPAIGGRETKKLLFCKVDGRDSLLVVSRKDDVRVWDLAGQTWTYHLPRPHGASITSVATFAPGGNHLVVFGCSDGRIRSWQSKQRDYYRVSQTGHTGQINDLAAIEHGEHSLLVSSGADATLRIWPDMKHPLVFPVTEPATRIATVGVDVVTGSGPALSLLRFTDRPEHWGDLDPDADHAFIATTDLPSESQADWFGDRYGRGRPSEVLADAKELLKSGESEAAVASLLPQLSHLAAAVCLAGDAAYVRGQPSLIQYVLPYLQDDRMVAEPSVQGRLVALSLSVDEGSIAIAASGAVGESVREATIGLIHMLDKDALREWDIYRKAARTVVGIQESGPFGTSLVVIPAMRLLAIARRESAGRVGEFHRRRQTLLEDYWQWYAEGGRGPLQAVLDDYLVGVVDENRPLPYQMISLYEVLVHDSAEDDQFYARFVNQLARYVETLELRYQESFRAWSVYSEVARAVCDLIDRS